MRTRVYYLYIAFQYLPNSDKLYIFGLVRKGLIYRLFALGLGRLYDVQKLQIPVIFICLMNSVFAEGIIYIYKVYIKHLLNVLDGLQIDRRYLTYYAPININPGG